MAWNEPGNNSNNGNGNKPQNPWGNNGGNNNDGPPDLDEALKKLQDKLSGIFGGGSSNNGSSSNGSNGKFFFLIIIGFAVIFAGMNSFFLVNEQERAVILRFGVYQQTVDSGFHLRIPFADAIYIENTTKFREHTSRGPMLTKDINIVEVELSVQYNISDVKNFVLRVRNPENSLTQATDSTLRHVVGSSVMDEVLTSGREKIATDVQTRLQQYMDDYLTGIQITTVNIESTQPPDAVQAAFDDVSKAREDEERVQNEAETYANGIVPEARGQAQRMLQEATAYQAQVIAQAEGEAQRFEALLTEYKKAPVVTRERLYLDAVELVFSSSSKIMIDVEGGNNMMYLPLDKLIQEGAANNSSAARKISSEDMNILSKRIADIISQRSRSTNTRSRESR